MLNFDLHDRVAFITGGTRGIGWAAARLFAASGASVIINGVSDETLLHSRVRKLKDEFNIRCDGYLFDVSDYDSVKNCYADIFKKYKKLDILVNNAGILDDSLLGMVSRDNINRTLDVNVKGVLYNLQYASRLMTRKKSGSIINVSSIIGRVGNEGQVVYGGSKAAVIGITMSAAKELAPLNIRVNAVAPGFIDTDMVKQLPEDKFKTRMDGIKKKRIGTPEDAANLILFLASDYSSYITGQIIGVDGGMQV